MGDGKDVVMGENDTGRLSKPTTVGELIRVLENFPPELVLKVLLFDATYDDDGAIIDNDNYRDMSINDVHDLFIGEGDKNFVAIEVPANDGNLSPVQLDTEYTVDGFYCRYNDCDVQEHNFETLQKLRTHQWHRHGRKGLGHDAHRLYWQARAAAHRRGEKWVGQGLPEGWSKGKNG